MANYIPFARTNYFRVKDNDAFIKWLDEIPGLEYYQDGKGFCILFDEGIPFWFYDDETGEERELLFMNELSAFLAEGEVAIAMEVGFEKLRYLTGVAIAVNDKGEELDVSINDIYKKVEKQWGTELHQGIFCES